MRQIMRTIIAVLGLFLMLLGAGVARADPGRIRVAWVAPIANWISIWLDKKDLARHLGKSYTFTPVHFAGTPPMVTAMANNEVEVGDLAFSTLPIAIKNAGLDDIRIIADDFQDGVPGYWTIPFAVLKDGPIKKVEDLKGKVVATNAEGSAVDIAMKAMLHKHGLEPNRDYTVIEAPFPAMKAMLSEHKVDLIPDVLPFALDPQMQKIARTLFTAKDAIGKSEFVSFQARKPFIDAHRAALVDWLEELAAHPALVHRPEKPRRDGADRGPVRQSPARADGLGVYQNRRLSRSEHAAGPHRAAAECRPDQGARLRAGELRRQSLLRPEHGRGSGQTAEITPDAVKALTLRCGKAAACAALCVCAQMP